MRIKDGAVVDQRDTPPPLPKTLFDLRECVLQARRLTEEPPDFRMLQKVLEHCGVYELLVRVRHMSKDDGMPVKLTPAEERQVAKSVKHVFRKRGERVCEAGTRDDCLWILLRGEV